MSEENLAIRLAALEGLPRDDAAVQFVKWLFGAPGDGTLDES